MSYEIQVTSDEFALVGICNPDLASRLCHGFPRIWVGWARQRIAREGSGLQIPTSGKIPPSGGAWRGCVGSLAGFVIPPSSWPRLPRIWLGWARQRIAREGSGLQIPTSGCKSRPAVANPDQRLQIPTSGCKSRPAVANPDQQLQIPTSGGGRRELITHNSSLITCNSSLITCNS